MHIRRRARVVATVLSFGAAACTRGFPDTATPSNQTEGSSTLIDELLPDSGPAAALIGDWVLRSAPPQRLPDLRLTVTVDSARGISFFGRLTNYISGDVGQDPKAYRAFSDSIRPNGVVAFSMPASGSEMLGILMVGRLAPDTILLSTFVLGPDTVSSGSRQWSLVKRR